MIKLTLPPSPPPAAPRTVKAGDILIIRYPAGNTYIVLGRNSTEGIILGGLSDPAPLGSLVCFYQATILSFHDEAELILGKGTK